MLIKEFLDANPNPIEPGYVFTLLPETTKDIYKDHVKRAAESLGLRCESFLDFKQPGDAFRDILTRIQKAEILIYDITAFTPNVMWELGLGLAIKDAERVIVIREESDSSLPFNIYSHRVSFQYDPNSEESLNELSKTLREVMQKINKASSRKAPIQSPEVKSLLDNALKSVERKEWIAAEALFQTMDAREPDNWYIHNQWGIMHRSKGEFEAAGPKFSQALKHTDFDDEKAFIYTEIAVLHQMSRRYADAEDWFRKAEKADSENNRLYIAWAEYHDELGDYFSAQAKIGGALARIKRRDDDPNFKELMLRHGYYDKKIKSPTYRKTFEQFKREAGRPPELAPPDWPENGRLPYNIGWEALVDNHVGAVVEGEISNITELGIFVRLCREFTGLIFWKNLMDGFGEKFSRNQKVKVRISKAFVNARDQRGRIDLRLVE
jgi:tetratricopeptide (TPR) repeat protein